MRFNYTIDDLRKYYQKTVESSERLFLKGDYEGSIKCVRAAAILQYNLNDIFVDSKVNHLLKTIADRLDSTPQNNIILDSNCVFFIDYYGIDNRGLTQQYLDAIVSRFRGATIVYIHESSFTSRGVNINAYLKKNNIETYELGKVSEVEKVLLINEIILKYKPLRVFFHLHPAKSLSPIIAFYSFPSILKYQINITDHAFWLGGPDFFNYSIEFRKYGAYLSLNKREFEQNQLRIIPYYPWQEKGTFDGFPIDTHDKIVLFAGGFLYKIEGEGNTFLDIAKRITEMDDRVVFFMAGGGNPHYFEEYVNNNNLHKKFYYIGDRHDINEVFNRVDIFLGTYPLGGGLMTQLAAVNSKPILLYKGFDNKELFLKPDKIDFIYQTIEDLLIEAEQLVKDSSYRRQRGAIAKELIISPQQFKRLFDELIDNHPSESDKFYDNQLDMSYIYSTYLKRINEGRFGVYLECLLLATTKRIFGIKQILNIILNILELKMFLT